MRPGSRTIRTMMILAACSVAAAAVPAVLPSIMVLAAFLLSVAVAEVLQLRRVTVSIRRPVSTALPVGEPDVFSIQVTTSAWFPVMIRVRQPWPDVIHEQSSISEGVCAPGEVLTISLTVTGYRRGRADLGPVFVEITRWRFGVVSKAAGSAADVAVMPNLKEVGRLHRQLNSVILRGYGSRTSPRLGKGREFDRMRDYVAGDELRDVAWRATARHGRLIVREYRLDRSQDILICLDTGHRMAARVGSLTRLDHAVNALVLLAYICNRMEDRVGLVSFASSVVPGLPAGRGPAHLRQLTAFLTDAQPSYSHTDYLGLAAGLRQRVRHRSLILLMTVLPELEDHHALLRSVRMLSPQHLVVVCVFRDVALHAAAHLLPADKHELSRVIAARELWDSRIALTRELRAFGAIVVDTPPHEFGTAAVNAYLDAKRRQLL